MGIVPTEMELILEQTQQEHQRDTKVFTRTMEILLEPTSNKLSKDSILQARNPVNEILLKLNLPDHSDKVLKLKNFNTDALLNLFKLSNQERYEHVSPKVTRSQDGKVYNMMKRDYARLMISRCSRSHIHVKSKLKPKSMIITPYSHEKEKKMKSASIRIKTQHSMLGVGHADKRANTAAAATTNALITMLKHIIEQVTSGFEELSASITILSLHCAIVSLCLKSRLLIESQSWGFVPQGLFLCMRTRNSYFLNNSSAAIPRRRNKRRTPNVVEPEFHTIVEMADNHTMEELLQAPIECNTIPNPKGEMKEITTRSGVAYKGPSIPTPKKVVERETEETTNKEQTNFQGSTAHIQPPVTPILEPDDKLFELAKIPLNENCSVMLLKKLHKKLGDPVNRIDIIDVAREEYAQEILEGDICLIEKLLNDDPIQLPPMDLKQGKVVKEKSLIKEPPELELKDLPSHLEYAYLEGADKLPVIIAKDLKVDEKEALLKVLKSHKRAIAWKIIDIEGIDPRFCTHKILMEEDCKPAVQNQRRVNPKIHEVIKKEVIKLVDAGMIYPISDSPWVSPIHCVPKKGGITVVENENNELIPTRVKAYLKDESISAEIDHADCDPEGDICLIEKLLNNDMFQLPLIDLKQGEVVKVKSSIEEPLKLELKDLPSHLELAYLEGEDKLLVIIAKDLKDNEKEALLKVLKSHKRAIA
nr:reverse transcriptase domain-containing protein [Tanacetum cinerariifolium]